jgi:glucose/arabinose dehydrogenase
MKRLAVSLALILGISGTKSAFATMLDSNFTETTFVNTSVGGVTGMAWAPDGTNRLFLTVKGTGSGANQMGTVRIVENGVLLPTPFATISPVYTASECGVLGIAFDPNFINNRYVYFFVTVSGNEQQIIRYTANGNVGSNKTTIVPNLPTAGANHDGGGVAFGPDGKLYWGIGDNGNGTGVDANLTSLAAKIGRANADGSVPSDNPYVDGTGPNADLIWARGFRNPFTMTFQQSTGRLWVNTVGTAYEQIFVPQRGDHAGYNDYENNQPSGFITPVVVYRTNGSDSRTITAAARAGGVSTFTTSAAHGFRLGGRIDITGVGDTSFNGNGYVTAVASATQFSIAQAGGNATSSGGTATTLNIGGAMSGGTFWESTALPAAYRGNFFFGDYNSGRIERVTLNSSNVVTSVDHWANNLGQPIDIDVGPDGNLYYVNYAGLVRRAVLAAPTQGLVVSPRFVRMRESGSGAFNVRLAVQPSANVSVTVSRASGDTDVTVAQGAALSFTTSNWSTPQIVTLAAAADTDTTEDSATIAVASSGLTTENVTVRVTDDNTAVPPTDGGTDAAGGTAGTGGRDGGVVDAAGGTAGRGDAAGGTAGTTGGTGPSDAAGGSAGSVASGGTGPGGATGSGGTADASPTGGAAGATGGRASGGRAGAPPAEEDDGCGCRTVGGQGMSRLAALALVLLVAGRRLRRKSRSER